MIGHDQLIELGFTHSADEFPHLKSTYQYGKADLYFDTGVQVFVAGPRPFLKIKVRDTTVLKRLLDQWT